MPGLYSKYIKLVHSLGDIAAVSISTAIAYSLVEDQLTNFFQSRQFELLLYSTLAWLACASLLGTYKFYRVTRTRRVLFEALKVILLYILLLEATLNIISADNVPRTFLINHYIFLAILVFFWRVAIITTLKILRSRGYNYRRVIIAGYSKSSLELEQFFKKHPEHGYRLLGFFDDNNTKAPGVIGKIDDITRFAVENDVDEIYCCPFELKKRQLITLLDFVDNNLIRLKFIPEPSGFHFRKLKVDFYDMLPVLVFRSIPLDDAINKTIKRIFDILFSFIVIVLVLSWLLPILAIIIKLDSKGPILFKQKRSGLDNQEFTCWKLRSMYVNQEANNLQASRGDARITPVGAFLRKTSLDELPQFFNVFVGNMSIVGPRPHMLKHTQEYALIIDKFMVRHLIKPGITGLSQIRGFRGDTSEMHQIRGRVKLDIFYLENWSFSLDLKIILSTILNVFRGDKHAF